MWLNKYVQSLSIKEIWSITDQLAFSLVDVSNKVANELNFVITAM